MLTRPSLVSVVFVGVAVAQQPTREFDPPFELPPGVDFKGDVVFASPDGQDLHLDLFLPRASEGPMPAVVYVFGGGWRQGNKQHFWRQAAHMATKGFVGACVEYRLSGEATFPAALEDTKAAVRWLRANAAEYGIDPVRIGAAGGSAGGHLASMLGTTHSILEFEGDGGNAEFSSRVRAVAAFNPVLNFENLPRAIESIVAQFMGTAYAENPQLWLKASPTSHVGKDSASFLFLHGTGDERAPYQQSVDMMNELQASGVRAELFTGEGAAHGFFNRPPWFEPTLKAMEKFFVDALGNPSSNQR